VAEKKVPPKAFVSHAGEDHERFVVGFAEKLRARGIDAWLDNWEIAPGDSLIERIFEAGIGTADAIIVVLSKRSVHKPWVREELNAGLVQRINKKTKLIPVVIDDCENELPVAVQHLAWQRVHDLESYDADVDRIVMAIHGYLEKPPLGEAPHYARLQIDVIPNLARADSLVLKTACEKTIERDDERVGAQEMIEALAPLGVSKEQVWQSLQILDGRGHVKVLSVMGAPHSFYSLKVTTFGLDQYLRVYMTDYDDISRAVGLRLVNQEDRESHAIIEALKQPRVIVHHMLDMLEQRGHVKSTSVMGGNRVIVNVSPELRRTLVAD